LSAECEQRACLRYRGADSVFAAVELRAAEQADYAFELACVKRGTRFVQLGST